MVCPYCSRHIAETWQPLQLSTDEVGRTTPANSHISSNLPREDGRNDFDVVTVTVQWLKCQNLECRQVLVRVTRWVTPVNQNPKPKSVETWFAVPNKRSAPPLDDSVTDPYRRDYKEAFIILEDSPRMSAVLSRRILADLLKKYDSATQFSLAARIDAFIANTQHPSRLRDNLHYLREIADFGAHTQVAVTKPANNQAPAGVEEEQVIDASPEEAEWTLKVVADLFDYFIVAPKKDEALRSSFDKKLEAAGRKPLRKPPNSQ
jgi:hypothetical protein